MKKILKNITIAGLVVLSLGSCKKDFLDTVKIGAQAEDSFYASDNDLTKASIAMYSPLWQYHYNWGRTVMGDECTDDAVDRELLMFQDYSFDAGHFLFRYNYRYNYRGILITNKLIANVEGVDKPLVKDKQLQKRVVAEAKFLRSFYYYDLLKNYGDVPLVVKPLLGEEMNMTRTPANEVYAQIEKDLVAAVIDLPLKGDVETGRVTKGAALAMLVKICATQASPGYAGQNFYNSEKYVDAKKYAEQLFALGNYSLFTGAYSDIFTEEGENGVGSIFEVQYYTTGKAGASAEAKYNNGNFNTFLMMPWFGGGEPYGKYMVSYDLYAAFENGDPRREASLYNVNQHADAWDGPDTTPLGTKADVQVGFSVKQDFGSFVNRKHWMNKADFDVQLKTSGVNERLIRLSDVYLLYAEACLATGDNGKSLEYINLVRERARVSGESAIPADLTSVTLTDIINERRVELCNEHHRRHDLVRFGILEKELKIDGFTAVALADPLLNKNGHPIMDIDGNAIVAGGILPGKKLIKYADANGRSVKDVNKNKVMEIVDVADFKATGLDAVKHMYFPIPLSEVDNTNGEISQNTGY